MDVNVFQDPNFNAVDWINHCYSEATATSSSIDKEAFVSTLVTQLETLVQSVNTSLERTSDQVVASMPKIFQNVQHLRSEALDLQRNMAQVQDEIAHVQRETGSCMANLERLDRVRSQLQVAKEGLQESDGWGRLTAELEDLFERSDMNGACDKIAVLQRSLAAQEGLPGQADRETEVEEAKNKLEALASPHVVRAFTAGDVEQAQRFVGMFERIGRGEQLRQYYRTVQRTGLLRQWTEAVELAETSSSNRFLREFYDLLLDLWTKQSKWCAQVFPVAEGEEATTTDQPTQLLIETLNRLEPSREAVIAQALKRTTDKLECLQEVSAANLYFGEALQRLLEVEKRPTEEQVALSRAIFDYFNSFINQYAAWEQNWLNSQLVQLNLNEAALGDSIRVLGNANAKVLQMLREVLRRCEGITKGCAIAPTVTVINSLLRGYMEKYRRAQKQLAASRPVEESWTLIQSCTTLLQHIGEFLVGLAELEPGIVSQLREVNERVQRQDLKEFRYKVLRKGEVNELKKLVVGLEEEGEGSLFGVFRRVVDEVVRPICAAVHETTLLSIFGPIEGHLKAIAPPEDEMHGDDLPDYSYAPQEYITQVGQYLMTLPQHLEPLLLAPSKALKLALEHSDERYTKDTPCGDVLLAMIAEDTCTMLLVDVLKLPELSTGTSKQLATDIDYLGSVLEELCLSLSRTLQQTSVLLRATQENYASVSAGCEPKLVMTIRQKRGLVIGEH